MQTPRITPGVTRREFLQTGLSALTASTVLSCGSPTGSGRTGPRLTARPGSPIVVPGVGSSSLDLPGGGNGLLYVPATYSAGTPAPLFIGLHGAGGSASDWESYYARAETRAMIFLAPDSRDFTWDLIAAGGFGRDVELLDEALQYTFDRCVIDPLKIALGGFSDGGSYALSLGVSNGDLLSHLVGYSPGFLASSPPTVGLPKVYVSHGTSDGVIPVSASRDSTVPLLVDAGYDVTYEEFDGGHAVPAAITESALNWFLDVG